MQIIISNPLTYTYYTKKSQNRLQKNTPIRALSIAIHNIVLAATYSPLAGTIGAVGLNGSVRNGKRCTSHAKTTKTMSSIGQGIYIWHISSLQFPVLDVVPPCTTYSVSSIAPRTVLKYIRPDVYEFLKVCFKETR